MKVKVGNQIYDGEKVMVMVILSDADKRNIANMSPDNARYCCYPEDTGLSAKNILQWMKTDS